MAGPCVAGEALCAGAGDGGDDAGGGVDLADAVVAGVGEVEVAGGVEGEGGGEIELGGGGEGVVAGEAGDAGAGDGGDDAGGEVEFADAVVVGVGDVEIVRGVEGQALGGVECGGGGGAASPEKPCAPVPAMVVMSPVVSTLRMTWLAVSAK